MKYVSALLLFAKLSAGTFSGYLEERHRGRHSPHRPHLEDGARTICMVVDLSNNDATEVGVGLPQLVVPVHQGRVPQPPDSGGLPLRRHV